MKTVRAFLSHAGWPCNIGCALHQQIVDQRHSRLSLPASLTTSFVLSLPWQLFCDWICVSNIISGTIISVNAVDAWTLTLTQSTSLPPPRMEVKRGNRLRSWSRTSTCTTSRVCTARLHCIAIPTKIRCHWQCHGFFKICNSMALFKCTPVAHSASVRY